MRHIASILVAFSVASPLRAQAQDAGLAIIRAAERPTRVAPAESFTGIARVQLLFDTTTSTRAYGATVAFDRGARTAWHTHPRGQVLIVTEGVGRVQRWGGLVDEIRPGDVVRIPPNVKHWHGAAPASAMTHVAIVELQSGRSTSWMERSPTRSTMRQFVRRRQRLPHVRSLATALDPRGRSR